MADQEKHHIGLIGTTLFHGGLLILLFFLAFRTPLPLPAEQGIMVDFGNTDLGLGNFEPPKSDPVPVQPQPETATSTQPQENLTQDIEESAALPEKSVPKPAAEISPKETQTKNQTPSPSPSQEKPVDPEPTVDPRSLFPGRGDASSTSTSQGEAGGQGNQGSPTGAPNVHVYGEGIDIGGGLADRGIVGGLPRPSYSVQEQGVVVVTVTVDSRGNVTNAEVRGRDSAGRGTTTHNETLRNAAVRAALQTKFSPNPNRIEQTGTITYTFKLKGE